MTEDELEIIISDFIDKEGKDYISICWLQNLQIISCLYGSRNNNHERLCPIRSDRFNNNSLLCFGVLGVENIREERRKIVSDYRHIKQRVARDSALTWRNKEEDF